MALIITASDFGPIKNFSTVLIQNGPGCVLVLRRPSRVRLVSRVGLVLDCPVMDTSSTPSTIEAQQLAVWLGRVAEFQDRTAFAQLFGHFAPRLKGYLIRLGCDAGMAEELVQDVMLTVWRKADGFDAAQAGVATWIYTIARNRRIDRLRHERLPELDLDDPLLVPDEAQNADEGIETAQREHSLRDAIGRLPKEQAELLQMAFFEDRPHSSIAAATQLPLGTVKSRIRLALARLKRELGPEGGL
jgi:RNA polymerase sigma factor (sigma-70 family)